MRKPTIVESGYAILVILQPLFKFMVTLTSASYTWRVLILLRHLLNNPSKWSHGSNTNEILQHVVLLYLCKQNLVIIMAISLLVASCLALYFNTDDASCEVGPPKPFLVIGWSSNESGFIGSKSSAAKRKLCFDHDSAADIFAYCLMCLLDTVDDAGLWRTRMRDICYYSIATLTDNQLLKMYIIMQNKKKEMVKLYHKESIKELGQMPQENNEAQQRWWQRPMHGYPWLFESRKLFLTRTKYIVVLDM